MKTHFELYVFGAALGTVGFIAALVWSHVGRKNERTGMAVLASILGLAALVLCALAFYNDGQANKTLSDLSIYGCSTQMALYPELDEPYSPAAATLAEIHRETHCASTGYTSQYPGRHAVFHSYPK